MGDLQPPVSLCKCCFGLQGRPPQCDGRNGKKKPPDLAAGSLSKSSKGRRWKLLVAAPCSAVRLPNHCDSSDEYLS